MKAPCKDCEKREVGCHSKCEEYQKFYKESLKRRKERRKEQNNWIRINDYVNDSRKMKRRKS